MLTDLGGRVQVETFETVDTLGFSAGCAVDLTGQTVAVFSLDKTSWAILAVRVAVKSIRTRSIFKLKPNHAFEALSEFADLARGLASLEALATPVFVVRMAL